MTRKINNRAATAYLRATTTSLDNGELWADACEKLQKGLTEEQRRKAYEDIREDIIDSFNSFQTKDTEIRQELTLRNGNNNEWCWEDLQWYQEGLPWYQEGVPWCQKGLPWCQEGLPWCQEGLVWCGVVSSSMVWSRLRPVCSFLDGFSVPTNNQTTKQISSCPDSGVLHLDLLLQLLVRLGLLLAHPGLGHPSALSGIVLWYKRPMTPLKEEHRS